MATLLEKVAAAAKKRDAAEDELRTALRGAKRTHSWAELADASGLSIGGVRHLVNGGANGSE